MKVLKKLKNQEASEENEYLEEYIESNKEKWNIKISDEENFWINLHKSGFTYVPNKCPTCNIGNLALKKNTLCDIINPFNLRCNSKKCRKIFKLRNFSFIYKLPKIPASIAYLIFEQFFIYGLNSHKIKNLLYDKYKKEINVTKIQKVLLLFRKIIHRHMKIKYNHTLIGGFNQEGDPRIVAIDESLFVHNQKGEAIWIIGGIETKERRIRLCISKERNMQAIENFVNQNFLEGTHFTHDGWSGYSFLNNNINYTHETHIHGGGEFGYGLHSTSHIESIWANLKKLIVGMYSIIPNKNFNLFLREAELRFNLIKKTKEEKLNNIKLIFKEVYENCQFEFGLNENF